MMTVMRSESGMSTNGDPTDPESLGHIQRLLLAWYGANARDLPWRHTRDPYAILVSEIMLQQIQVVRAITFYLAFMARFPTVESLARASVSDVIHVWCDLGRYKRITSLHTTARRIVTDFGGIVPADVAVLQTLPGIGPYTAGAVACFAYGKDVGFLDTNARRVIHRVFVGCDVPAATASMRRLQGLASQVVPSGQGWSWNQAVIELGALTCTARRPKCAACHIQEHCAARATIADAVSERLTSPRGVVRRVGDGQNRLYRGRILAELRAESAGVHLRDLGGRLRPGFTDEDVPWIAGVVESLRKDGLAFIEEERSLYSAESVDPTADAGSRMVRLPD